MRTRLFVLLTLPALACSSPSGPSEELTVAARGAIEAGDIVVQASLENTGTGAVGITHGACSARIQLRASRDTTVDPLSSFQDPVWIQPPPVCVAVVYEGVAEPGGLYEHAGLGARVAIADIPVDVRRAYAPLYVFAEVAFTTDFSGEPTTVVVDTGLELRD